MGVYLGVWTGARKHKQVNEFTFKIPCTLSLFSFDSASSFSNGRRMTEVENICSPLRLLRTRPT